MHRQKVTPQQWLNIANERLKKIPEVPCSVRYINVSIAPTGNYSAVADGLSELTNPQQRVLLSRLLNAIVDEVSLDYKPP